MHFSFPAEDVLADSNRSSSGKTMAPCTQAVLQKPRPALLVLEVPRCDYLSRHEVFQGTVNHVRTSLAVG